MNTQNNENVRSHEEIETIDSITRPNKRIKRNSHSNSSEHRKDFMVTGTIKSLELHGFMCFEHFKVEFGPWINMISGANGSGKSALLAAIQLVFGARSGLTGRASSLKEFIREQSNFSSIEVTLCNLGKEAFRPDIMGDEIRVRRRISKDGSSTFQIKNSTGNLVLSEAFLKTINSEENQERNEKGKKETYLELLKSIKEAFNIQIENPCLILTQDNSRSYLKKSSPVSNYKFWLKATLLEDMYVNLKETDFILEQIVGHANDYNEMIKEKNILLENQRIRWESFRELHNWKDQVKEFKLQLMWAFVCEQEKIMEHCENEKEQAIKSYTKAEKSCDERKDIINQKTQEASELDSETERIRRELEEAISNNRDAIRKEKNRRKEIDSIEKSLNQISDATKALEKKNKDLEERIAEETRKLGQDLQDHVESKKRELNEIGSTITSKETHIQALNDDIDNLQKQKVNLNLKITERVKEVSNIESLKDSTENDLRRAGNRDKSALYGDNIPRLLKLLNSHKNRFVDQPIGPIGMFITVKNKRYTKAIESCLGSILSAFIVGSYTDEITFKAYSKQSGMKYAPQIFVKNLRNPMYSNEEIRRPNSIYSTILDQISVSNTAVYNFLIDVTNCENIVITEDKREGSNIISREVRNVSKSVLLDGFQYYKRGNSVIGDGFHMHTRNVLSSDKEQITRQYQGKIKELISNIVRLNDEIDSMRKDEKNLLYQITNIRKTQSKIVNEIKQLKNKERRIKNDLYENTSLSVNVDTLRDSIQENEAELEEWKRKEQEYNTTIAEMELNLKEIVDNVNETEEKVEECQLSLKRSEEMLNIVSTESDKAISKLNKAQTVAAAAKELVEEKEAELKNAEANLSEKIKLASDYGERVEVDMKSDRIERKMNNLQLRIEREEKRENADPYQVKRELDYLEQHVQEITKEYLNLKGLIVNIDKILKKRKKSWLTFRDVVSQECSLHFNTFLAERNMSGSMTFDHNVQNETLNLTVIADTSVKSKTQNTSTLSGGERSLTTVAFLNALWKYVDTPFRALDEFDVYMDNVNRRETMKALLKGALSLHSQFFFLSPLDMSIVIEDPHIKIIRMPTPKKRGDHQKPNPE